MSRAPRVNPGALVFSIQGPHGVGKSTLVRGLRQAFPEVKTYGETFVALLGDSLGEPRTAFACDEFVLRQRRVIAWELRRCAAFAPWNLVLLDRGPEATEFYTLAYPGYYDVAWNPEAALAHELSLLRKCRSTAILYLTATEECIRERIDRDGKRRPSFERWLSYFEPRARPWFNRLSTCTVLDTTELSTEQVLVRAVDWMNATGAELSGRRRSQE